MLADLLGTFPATGQLNTEVSTPDSNKKIYTDLLTELRKTLKKHGDQNDSVLPLECHFLNKNAFISVVGHQPQPSKHFSLKRKPKAAALKADLMARSVEAATKVKSQPASFPQRIRTMPKKLSDTTPLKGIRAGPAGLGRSFSNPSNRVSLPNRTKGGAKEGGVKLLDITEQPMGYQAAKKKKRQEEQETQKRVAEEAAINMNIKQELAAQATPDYAANLPSSLAPAAAAPPAYVPPAPAAPNPAPVYAPTPPTVGPPLATPQAALPGSTLTVQLPTTPLPQSSTVTRLVQLPTQPLPQGQARLLSSQGVLSTMAPRPVTAAPPQHILQLQQPGLQVRQQLVAQPPPILRQVRLCL